MLAEMAASAATGLSVLDPLRVIGSIVLGEGVLSSAYPLFAVVIAGVFLHMLLSAGYGGIFTGALVFVREEIPSSAFLMLGLGYSLVLWIVNFLVIAPVLSPQISTQSQLLLGFTLAHAIYGIGIGGYLTLGARQRETIANR